MEPDLIPALATARRLVVKIGSALLVDRDTGHLKAGWLEGLADDVARARSRGQGVILVSSGSIALGRCRLNLSETVMALDHAQAAAALGQIQLIRAYHDVLNARAITAAQILVTLEDSVNRRRYLNSRATFETLLGMGVVPIVNENDTVATDEIRYGDNDRLAAQVAAMAGADQLVLLSDVDGLYTANPAHTPGAVHIPVVSRLTNEIRAMAGESVSGISKGGMVTKLMAAQIATEAGCAMAISRGTVERPLRALENGARCTWFLPREDPQSARSRWISAMKPRGTVAIDAGAQAALGCGKSLLPAGVSFVGGTFERGDPVAIEGPDAAILGYPGRAVLIHRDDMVL